MPARDPCAFVVLRDGHSGSDQARTGTPAAALADGADQLVLGRAVTAADDPATALDKVLEEIGVPA